MNALHPNTVPLHSSTIDIVETARSGFERLGSRLRNIAFLQGFLFAKTSKTYNAFYLLWTSGFEEDSYVLLRTMFELQLQSAFVHKNPDHSTKLFREFADYDNKFVYDSLRQSESPGDAVHESDLFLKELGKSEEEIQSDHKRLRDQYNRKRDWYGMGIDKLAKEVGKAKEYYSMNAFWSRYIHSGPISTHRYLDMESCPVRLTIGPSKSNSDLPIVTGIGLLLAVCNNANKDVSLGLDSRIRKALKGVEKRNKDIWSDRNPTSGS